LQAALCEKEKALTSPTLTPEKRERYAHWLRNTGVEHPSDELIDKTRKEALSQMGEAKEKARRYKLRLAAVVFGSLVAAVRLWVKF
jgi:hypothetical protein